MLQCQLEFDRLKALTTPAQVLAYPTKYGKCALNAATSKNVITTFGSRTFS